MYKHGRYFSKSELYGDLKSFVEKYEKSFLEEIGEKVWPIIKERERVIGKKFTSTSYNLFNGIKNLNRRFSTRNILTGTAIASLLTLGTISGIRNPDKVAEYIPFWNNDRERIEYQTKIQEGTTLADNLAEYISFWNSKREREVYAAKVAEGTALADKLLFWKKNGIGDYAFYTVKRGDTLSTIARNYGMNLDSILELNPEIKDLNKIQPGQRIKFSKKSYSQKQYQNLRLEINKQKTETTTQTENAKQEPKKTETKKESLEEKPYQERQTLEEKITAENAREYYSKGKEYYFEEDYENARKEWEKIKEFLNVHNDIGLSYVEERRYKEAEKEFTDGIQVDDGEDLFMLYNNLGAANFGEKNYNLAINNFEKALDLTRVKGDKALIEFNVFLSLVKQGKKKEAEKYYEKLLEEHPGWDTKRYSKEYVNYPEKILSALLYDTSGPGNLKK